MEKNKYENLRNSYGGNWVFIKNDKVMFFDKCIYNLCEIVDDAGLFPGGSDIVYIEKVR